LENFFSTGVVGNVKKKYLFKLYIKESFTVNQNSKVTRTQRDIS